MHLATVLFYLALPRSRNGNGKAAANWAIEEPALPILAGHSLPRQGLVLAPPIKTNPECPNNTSVPSQQLRMQKDLSVWHT